MRSFGGLGGTLVTCGARSDSPLASSPSATRELETPNKGKRTVPSPAADSAVQISKFSRNSGGGINFTVKPSSPKPSMPKSSTKIEL